MWWLTLSTAACNADEMLFTMSKKITRKVVGKLKKWIKRASIEKSPQ